MRSLLLVDSTLTDATSTILRNALDITGAEHVQVSVDNARHVLHVNINGVCAMRVCRIKGKIEVGHVVEAEREIQNEDLLEDLLEYFDGRQDVVDGDYGVPEPNKEMALYARLLNALGRGGY